MNSALKTLLLLALTAGVAHADDPAFFVQAQDANTKTWVQTNEVGEVTSSYVEVATGLSKKGEVDGTWTDADPSIVVVQGAEGGAVAQNGQHRLILSADANSQNATVDVEMPDGQRIQLQTIGIALTSLDNSRSMFIGEVKQSIGEQVDANTVIYPDAFTPIKASIRIRNTLAGLESDVILEEKIDPADWNFLANDCKLEVWTQVLQSPAAHVKVEHIPGRRVGDADQDQQIAFDSMAFAKGTAFRLDSVLPGPSEKLAQIRVAKELANFPDENLSFLIESIPFIEAKPQVDTLPVEAVRLKPAKDILERAMAKNATGKRAKPHSLLAQANPKGPRNLAMAALSGRSALGKPGFVMDYTVLNTGVSGYVFKGDTTYSVTADVALGSTSVFEGGAVIKLNSGFSLILNGPATFLTSPYRPLIITGMDDHSVGEKVGTNPQASSNAYYGTFALKVQNGVANNSISNVVIRHAQTAIYMAAGSGGTVRHAQIINSGKGIDTLAAVSLRNVLMGNIGTRAISGTGAIALTGQHLTLDGPNTATAFFTSGGATLSLLNSIVYGFGTLGSYTKTSTVDSFSALPFLPTGAGYYYISPATTNLRDSGTTAGVDTLLLKEFRQMTTEAPQFITTDFVQPTVLYPVVRRDADVPDLGFHYFSLDYLWSGRTVTSTLVLTNGVAVGWNSAVGLTLGSGSAFYSEGKPDQLNRLVRLTGVQEQPGPIVSGTSTRLLDIISTASIPSVRMRFTDVPFQADTAAKRRLVESTGYILTSLSLVDSSFRGATCDLNPSKSLSTTFNISLTNNYCERVTFSFTRNASSDTTPVNVWVHQNLFRYGSLNFANFGAAGAWGVCNNLFDTNTLTAGYNSIVHGTNAYFNTPVMPGSTSGNKTVTTVDYVSGPLGNVYYPASGTGLFTLVNQGNRNADTWGLYHYTTQTSQIKEFTSAVDIGFHYVAVDSNGLPIDTDGDGPPDYLEDTNGNGTSNAASDAGETDWNISNSGWAGASSLIVFTQLK